MSNIAGNRHSTPEAANSLRPPNQRASASAGGGHLLRASADMSGTQVPSPLSGRNIRPSSEYYQQNQNGGEDAADSAAQKWLNDIETFEVTLEEMAAATVDQDFKDELSAIEQWFKVLTEAERTAALYALLQQTTQVQVRFFIQVLQEMAKGQPVPGMLSPSNFGDKDTLSNRMSDASGKLAVAGNRESMGGRPPASPGKRNSGLPQEQINAMFPAAASAIANKRAEYTQQTGNQPTSNRNSAAFGAGDRSSLNVPSAAGAADSSKDAAQSASWTANKGKAQETVASPMGQFTQPPPSAGLRSGRPAALNQQSLHGPTGSELPMMSPAFGNGSWASMTNTPMVANFNQAGPHADMMAQATHMKLAALSTVNQRVNLDDPKKYRRTRSNDGQPLSAGFGPVSPGVAPGSVLVVNESGQLVNGLTPQQLAQMQLQQAQNAMLMGQNRSRPNSPGMAMRSPGMSQASPLFGQIPQHNGFLAAYDGSGLSPGMAGLNLTQFGMGGGSVSGEEMERGRSPRGRRGSSKPPEDPTDLKLLDDIPAWLRMLRLHKYTDQLKDVHWKKLVDMDDAALEERGVAAVGARRKMLKAFEQVKEAQAAGKL